MTRRLIQSFALILLAAASVYADQTVKAQIPFSFHVGDSILPAGWYTTETNMTAGGVLRLRSDDGKSSAMALSTGVAPLAAPTQAKLVFHKYGDEYFLFQVWTGTGSVGREIPRSRREKELGAAAKRGVQTILAQQGR